MKFNVGQIVTRAEVQPDNSTREEKYYVMAHNAERRKLRIYPLKALHALKEVDEKDVTPEGGAPEVAPEVIPLRDDGPTLEEFIAAGYEAVHYPPKGYKARPSVPSKPKDEGEKTDDEGEKTKSKSAKK